MTDQSVTLNVERTGVPGFSGARPYSGSIAKRGQQVSRESAHSQDPAAVDANAAGDSVRLVRDEETGRSCVQILDRKTGEVLYEIPPEEVQKLAKILKDMTGLMVNEVV